jgi:hypothetical protein
VSDDEEGQILGTVSEGQTARVSGVGRLQRRSMRRREDGTAVTQSEQTKWRSERHVFPGDANVMLLSAGTLP